MIERIVLTARELIVFEIAFGEHRKVLLPEGLHR